MVKHLFKMSVFIYVKVNDGVGNNSSTRAKSRLPATDDSEHSQSDTITYDDPAGRMERERIMAQLKRGASPSPDCNTEEDEEDTRDNTTRKVGKKIIMSRWSRKDSFLIFLLGLSNCIKSTVV